MRNINLIFENLTFVLDSGLSFKKKKNLKKNIIQHGGTISYILNKTVSCLLVQINGFWLMNSKLM